MLLKVAKKAMPMPTDTADEQEAFWNALVLELPAFIDHLLHFEIPTALRSSRFGILHYHHPELLAGLEALAPEHQLLEMIDQAIFGLHSRHGEPWTGFAVDLQVRLTGEFSPHRRQAENLLHSSVSCGTYLSRLAGKQPDRISFRRINGRTEYTIQAPYSSDEHIS